MSKLSLRLQTLADMIQPGSIVADIGTDHALLPAFLVQNQIITKAYACDIAVGPLDRAKALIQEQGLQDQITAILGGGLSKVPEDADTAVIAGMGFDTIKMILEENLSKLYQFRHIILQANTGVEELRRWISDHHFTIIQERLVKDGHFYTMIDMNTAAHEPLSEAEIRFGCGLDQQASFLPYWQFRLTKLETILQQMPINHPKYFDYQQQLISIRNKLADVRKRS